MSVYVDNYNAKFRRMIMCHMTADTRAELFEMADKIGLPRRYCHDGTHFDVCLTMKKKALQAGAKEIGLIELAGIAMKMRKVKH